MKKRRGRSAKRAENKQERIERLAREFYLAVAESYDTHFSLSDMESIVIRNFNMSHDEIEIANDVSDNPFRFTVKLEGK